MPGKLSMEEAWAFLDSRPGWLILTTIGRDGYPHSVPIGYFRLQDEIFLGCNHPTQKTRNIERNPQVSLLVESGSTMSDIKGVLIQGDADIVTEDEERLLLAREAARIRGVPEDRRPAEVAAGAAYIRIRPKRTISWDYSKSR